MLQIHCLQWGVACCNFADNFAPQTVHGPACTNVTDARQRNFHDADNLGAVTRTVLETMRTLFVWVSDLALYYSPLGGSGKVGEQWDSHSWMQARIPPPRGACLAVKASATTNCLR